LTVTFPGWAAQRERYRQESDRAYAAARKALLEDLTTDLGRRVADLKAAAAWAENQLQQLANVDGTAPARSRLEMAREPVPALAREYEELLKRLAALPVQRDWLQTDFLAGLQREADGFRERVELCLACLRAELVGVRAPAVTPEPARPGETHCAACGRTVPRAPFCAQCGAVQPVTVVCPECGETNILPVHFFPTGVLPPPGAFLHQLRRPADRPGTGASDGPTPRMTSVAYILTRGIQKEVTMSESQLTLSAEERTFLVGLLELVLKDTLIEEHRTRTPSFRAHIVHREGLINGLLSKLGHPPK
jgi:hypothetical protein